MAHLHPLRKHLGLFILLLAVGLLYLPLLEVAFSWDDEALVVDNQVTGSLMNLREFFTRDLWGTTRIETLQSGYYRPLMLVSLAVDRALFGLSSGAAHLHSILWHLTAVGALYALLLRLLGSDRALLGAALFAVHPVQSEVLALVAARNDAMAAAISLMAILCVLDRDANAGRAFGAFLLLLSALLCKESAVLTPGILLALDLARDGRPHGWHRYGALIAAVLAVMGMRWLVGVDVGIVPGGNSWQVMLEHAHQIVGLYGSLVVWPWPLTPARYVHYLPPLAQTAPGLLVLLGGLGWALSRGAQPKLVGAGLFWAALVFAPSLAATLDKGLLGERYLYFPLAGLGLVVAAALPRVPKWSPWMLVLVCGVVLQVRLPDWKDSRTVWTRAHAVDPSPFTAAGLAWYLHRDGDVDQSIPLFVEALEGEPPYRDACGLVVRAFLQEERVAEAVAIGRWALQFRGCDPNGLIGADFTLALAANGQWDEALRILRTREAAGSALVVLGAAKARSGDLQQLDELSQQWSDRTDYFRRVLKLLRLSGEVQAYNRLKQAVDAAEERAGSSR